MSSAPIKAIAYQLADAEARAAANPSFQIPDRKTRHAIAVGYLVLLCFKDAADPTQQPAAERMWVEVQLRMDSSEGETSYVGRLICDPIMVRGIALGDLVHFEPKHVAAIEPPEEMLIASGPSS